MKKGYILYSLLVLTVGVWTLKVERNIHDHGSIYSQIEAEYAQVNQQEEMPKERNVEQAVEKDLEALAIDIEKKKKDTQALVQRAKEYFNEHTLEDSCNKFAHTKEFLDGELYIFVFDDDGIVFAHGQEEGLIWQNLIDLKDNFGSPIVQNIIDIGRKGGGWSTYQWRNATKNSWVQPVSKDGDNYVIGAGYYPHSKESTVISLVKGAASLFNQVIERGQPPVEAFSDMSYPLGKFVFADLYIFVLNDKGELMAQGDRPNLIGTNVWDYKDENGVLINQEIIKKATESMEGIWVEYTSKRAFKRSYAEKVTGKDGTNYFIVCGYYPEADSSAAVDLVRKGYTFMKRSGKSAAAEEFTDKQNDEFRYGDLYLVGYDMKGICFAHGGNPELEGKNLWDVRDEDGRYYVREIIEQSKKAERGWVTFKLNRSFRSVYFEPIDLGIGRFVLTCGTYPVSKKDTTELLVGTAASYLKINKRAQALNAFIKRDGAFVSGDLNIFVFDDTGLCYAYGTEYDLIWRNLLGLQDDDGKPFVKLFINSVLGGNAQVSFKLNNSRKIAYLAPVEKDGIKYTVGSSFYL